jgi:phosphoribosyl 1,2-cyclic phosphodiesterase
MRLALLGSGSRGNGTLVQSAGTTLLVDCGFSVRDTERRLARLGIEPMELSAILLTHEHGDHASGVGAFARKHDLEICLSAGTLRAAATELGVVRRQRLINGHESFSCGDIEVTPLPVPHDACEPTQFLFSNGARRLGVVTDVGRPTPFLCRMLDGCDALVLEFNHDADMLANGPYPEAIKQRVAGEYGHLSNAQSSDLLRRTHSGRLRHLVAAHLSERNNHPELVRAAAAAALGCTTDWIAIAGQDAGLDWREI